MYEVVLAFSVLTFVVAGIIYIRHPAFSIFHPLAFYMCFHGIVFVIRPILAFRGQFSQMYEAFQFVPSLDDKITVSLATNLGFIVFFITCLWAGNAPMWFKQDKYTLIEKGYLKSIFPQVLAISLPIGIYSTYHFWTTFAGMDMDFSTGIAINKSGNGYFLEAQTLLASATALIAWVYRFRIIAFLPFIAFLVVRAGTGVRGPLIAAMAMVALLYFYEKRQRLPTARLMLVMAAALVVFNYVGADRGAAVRRTVGLEANADFNYSTSSATGEKFLERMDFANMEFFEYIVHVVPGRSGTYDYFLDNLQLLTEPIPRSLWTSKPIGPPIQRVNLMNYGRPFGMTRSLPGEGWYAWGWIGVAIWCGLWGWALGRIYQNFAVGPQNSLHAATYMVFLPILIVAYRDGSIVTIFREGIFYFFPLAVWAVFARYKSIPTARTLRFAAYRKWRKQAVPETRGQAETIAPRPGEPGSRGSDQSAMGGNWPS